MLVLGTARAVNSKLATAALFVAVTRWLLDRPCVAHIAAEATRDGLSSGCCGVDHLQGDARVLTKKKPPTGLL
jgi:hypothetical protein